MPDQNQTRLVFRGDDAGSCESANLAIAEGVEAGTIKNVSIMACGPALEHAASLLKERDDIDLGLHVTLNAEWVNVKWPPVLPSDQVPSLLEEGTPDFTASPRLLRERGFVLQEAIAEVRAQLERARSLELKISYMDEHMGVGSLPGLRSALQELCAQERIPHFESFDVMRLPAGTEPDLVDRWLSALRDAPSGTYLVVTHPGCSAPDMEIFFEAGGTPGVVAKERNAERQALADDRLRAGLDALGVQIMRFSDLVRKE